jgi:hypothetical protein
MLLRTPRHPCNAFFMGEMSACDCVASVICDCELRTLFRYLGTFPACTCSRCIAWALNELHVLLTTDQLSLTHGCHVPREPFGPLSVVPIMGLLCGTGGRRRTRVFRAVQQEYDDKGTSQALSIACLLDSSQVCIPTDRQTYRHTLRLDAILRQHPKAWSTASVCFPDVVDSMTKLSTKTSWAIDRLIGTTQKKTLSMASRYGSRDQRWIDHEQRREPPPT